MYVEDQKEVLRTNLSTTQKRYQHGRIRIEIQLYLQLGGFTANRPAAILGLCYRHVIATLIRDPEGGPNQVLLEFTFEFTKDFLGAKDMYKRNRRICDCLLTLSSNTFPVPEIIYDPSLVFSPHVTLLGLMFADNAFLAPNLTSPEQLSKLEIPPGSNQLPLPLDPKKSSMPVFRRAIRELGGWVISSTEPLPYNVLYKVMVKLGQITGFKQILRPYALRYGAGKAFNEDGQLTLLNRAAILTQCYLQETLVKRFRI
jgi:hypothetical protein